MEVHRAAAVSEDSVPSELSVDPSEPEVSAAGVVVEEAVAVGEVPGVRPWPGGIR
jgi:hypothetical protein